MRDEVLEFLRQNQGSFVSGQDMSEACHVSRTAIWKHIKALRQKGYKIESYTKRGYRLLEEPDLLSPLAMKQILKTDVFGKRYVYMDTTESTNLEARRLAQQGAEEGTVVVTEEQAAGRGRLSRGWYSPFGKGLWFSLILRPDFPPVEAPKCTLMAAVALTKAFHKMGLTDAGIKWPNDILVNGRKLVGILTEMSGSMEEISHIVMGIGVNVKTKQEELPEELKLIATSLAMEDIDIERTEAFRLILEELEHQYYEVLDSGFDETLNEWRQLSVTLGEEIEVRAPGNTYEGAATDIDEGNTNIVLGVYDKTELVGHWRISTDRVRTTDEYGMLMMNLFFHDRKVDVKDINAIIISSVVPPLMPTLERVCLRYFNVNPLIVGPGTKTGIAIKYDNPREVGADRIVNAVAAHELYKGDLIIIDFGTATTYCAVQGNGDYMGGVISPGVTISAEALFQRAAKLPRIDVRDPGQVICRNTVSSMQSGMFYGYVGQVEGLVSRMKAEMGNHVTVVATGGLAQLISSATDCIDHVEPMLTLEGLRLIYERNK